MIRGLHHISLKCNSPEEYERTYAFYHDLLGLPVYRSWTEGVLFSLGSGYLEIFKNGQEPLPQGVIRHFALEVDDVDSISKKVQENGYEIFMGPKDISFPSDPVFEARVAFCKGPLGEDVEFFMPR